ncbi:hypothetical protein PMIN06_007713 [Paraphaeosphaeria minitans]
MAPPRVQVLSSTRLHPTHRPASPTTIPLSVIDASVARFTPAGAVWYLSAPSPGPGLGLPSTTTTTTTTTTADPLSQDLLKDSLAHTLSAYPHFAGQLRMTPYVPGSPGRKRTNGELEVRYNFPGPPPPLPTEKKKKEVATQAFCMWTL